MNNDKKDTNNLLVDSKIVDKIVIKDKKTKKIIVDKRG
jgi:hypothetical protein